jgi:hypothetical protein
LGLDAILNNICHRGFQTFQWGKPKFKPGVVRLVRCSHKESGQNLLAAFGAMTLNEANVTNPLKDPPRAALISQRTPRGLGGGNDNSEIPSKIQKLRRKHSTVEKFHDKTESVIVETLRGKFGPLEALGTRIRRVQTRRSGDFAKS